MAQTDGAASMQAEAFGREKSVLTDGLPRTITVSGNEFPLETDYRVGILMQELAADESLTEEERFRVAIALYGLRGALAVVEPDALWRALLGFWSMRESDGARATQQAPAHGARGEILLDFRQDGNLLFAAFWQAYGINLAEKQFRLHWWAFLALLSALPEDTALRQRIRLRALDLRTIADEEVRRRLRRAKALVRVRPSWGHTAAREDKGGKHMAASEREGDGTWQTEA